MTLRRIAALSVMAALAAGGSSAAQPSTLERGEELERLSFLEGRWKGEVTRHLPGGRTLEVKEDLVHRWDLGGVWLRGTDESTLPGGKVIHNQVWITWDPGREIYRGGWHDNVFPAILTFEGRWLDERRLLLDSGPVTIRGRAHRSTTTYTIVSEDEYRTEIRMSWGDGDLEKVGEGRFTRAGAAPDGKPGRGAS